ncbi:MAG: PAS domain S-box protein [Chloroflexota bacterium]|nr:PAS domain S-box protein [Chloroflexota bacterium]
MERLLYLLLVLYSGWALGIIGGVALWLSSGVAMLLRVFLISPHFRDALLESFASLIIGALGIMLMRMWRSSSKREGRLKKTMDDLRSSQQKYEELFANASDAIWIHSMEGNIVLANKACEKLTGYPVPELIGKNVSQFLKPEALDLARGVKHSILSGGIMDQRYEQRLIRKDGSEAIMQLATRLIVSGGNPQAFHNIAHDITEERKLRDNLQFYLRECLKAQEDERKRLSSELHDDTLQQILLLAHGVDNLASQTSSYLPKELRNEFEKLYELTQISYQGVKRYAQALRPRILDDLGLVPALKWLAQEITNLIGIKVQVETDAMPPLASEIQLVLFRIAQEALNNVYRHSEASEVSIVLEHQVDKIKMTIRDNGRGFELPRQLSDFASQGKLGLTGIAERVRIIGGEVEFTSKVGKGTKITVKAPTKLYSEDSD